MIKDDKAKKGFPPTIVALLDEVSARREQICAMGLFRNSNRPVKPKEFYEQAQMLELYERLLDRYMHNLQEEEEK